MDADWLRTAYGATKARTRIATAVYEALRSTGDLSSHRAISYRCPRRCLLLDVLVTPEGLIAHSPRYKLSPSTNAATSNEAGRSRNTEDGDRRWKSRTYFTQDAANFPLNCDHLRIGVLELAEVVADIEAGRSEVTIHPQR